MNSSETVEPATQLERRIQQVFGMPLADYDREVRRGIISRAHLDNAIRIVDDSGVVTLLEQWRNETKKSSAGRKPIFDARAILVLFLLHVQAGQGANYKSIANTLYAHFTPMQFARLGVRRIPGDANDWYHRFWGATKRMMALIDPLPTPRNRNLDANEYEQLKRNLDSEPAQERKQKYQNRIDEICNLLVKASLAMLPDDIWSRYKGNIAIDATKAEIRGIPNSARDDRARSNPDPLSGRYRREGSHGGQGAATDEAAYELETAVSIWNTPGANDQFPSLVTAISCHNPGAISGHAVELIRRHQQLGFHRVLVVVDRAYNGEKIENFHIPARKLGCEIVVDYKKSERGIQGTYADLILLGGNWHVATMPEDLVTAGTDLEESNAKVTAARDLVYRLTTRKAPLTSEEVTELEKARTLVADATAYAATFYERIDNRAAYRMIPKGLPDKDGYQRFTYPDPLLDLTGHATYKAGASITIPLLIPEETSPRAKRSEKPQPVKYLQKFSHGTREWRAHYGMRSLVEASNNLLKHPQFEDMANKSKRSGRGYAFNYLAMALSVVSSNVRRIWTFFNAEAAREDKPLTRRRRRQEPSGRPLLPVPDLPDKAEQQPSP